MTVKDFIEENKELISEVFGDDEEKALRWLARSNANFGGTPPEMLIEKGRSRKVRLFLEAISCEQ